jgi:hypothetical protein
MSNASETDPGDNARQKASRPLSPKAAELLTERTNGLPVWIRAPKNGTEFYSGFSRAKLYELAGAGKIRSVSIRVPGAIKGTRLFHLSSILDFIGRSEQENAAQPKRERTEVEAQ